MNSIHILLLYKSFYFIFSLAGWIKRSDRVLSVVVDARAYSDSVRYLGRGSEHVSTPEYSMVAVINISG